MLKNSEIQAGIRLHGKPLWKALERCTQFPQKTQQNLLHKILAKNKDTEFGREHSFRDINSIKDFRAQVPIQTYESLEPYILAQDKEKKPYLTSENPAFFVQTSGTTGWAKFIPVLNKNIEQANQRSLLFNYLHFRLDKYFFSGKILSIVGSAADSKTESNTPCGSYSGLLYKLTPDNMMHKYLLPKAFFDITDYEAEYLLIAGLALAEKNISLLVTANPSVFLKLLSIIRTRWKDLLAFVETGDLKALSLDQSFKQYLPEGFQGNEARAKDLDALIKKTEQIAFSNLWPSITSIVTWTSGSCGFSLSKLKPLLPPETRILDLGYIASEFIGTLTIDGDSNEQIPLINYNFYEFIEPKEWEVRGVKARVLSLDELEKSKQYFVIVTAQNGFYRYFINDLIEVTGFFNKTPTIRFIQKGKGVTDLAGEKLYEQQLMQAMNGIKNIYNFDIDFYLMLADLELQRYLLFVECDQNGYKILKREFEKELAKINVGIHFMRNDGALKSTQVVRLRKGAAELYKKHCLEKGQREAQFKVMTLQYSTQCDFDFQSVKY